MTQHVDYGACYDLDMASSSIPSLKALTYRVENIPSGTSKEELKGHFHPDDQPYIKVKSLVPSVDTAEAEEDGDYTATVFFRPQDPSRSAPRLSDDYMYLDKDFLGFTPLYVPPKENGPIVADIIAVTGLSGHAYGSWAHSPERMWLRDYLPKDAPNARILTYGYPSKLQGNASMSILSDHTNTFVHRIFNMRESTQCVDRPVIFIGHSLGCLIIKKALTDVGMMGLNSSRIPIRAIIFLAAPHRGLNITALQTLVNGAATEQLILELRAESPTLTDINQRFTYIARDVDILTCYETQPTKTAVLVDGTWKREGAPVMMVSPDSASQYYPRERRIPVDVNHSQIAKILKGESGIYPNIRWAVQNGLIGYSKGTTALETRPALMPDNNEDVDNVGNSGRDRTSFQNWLPYHDSPAFQPSPFSQSPRNQPLLRPKGLKDTQDAGEQLRSGPPTPQQVLEVELQTGSDVRNELGSDNSGDNAELVPSSISVSTVAKMTPRGKPALPHTVSPLDDAPISQEATAEALIVSSFAVAEPLVNCSYCKKSIPRANFCFTCHACDGHSHSHACQQCHAKGVHCPEKQIHHRLEKSIVKEYAKTHVCLLYPKRDTCDGDTEIVKLLKRGSSIKLDQLAEDERALQAPDKDGFTPLHLAAQLGIVEGAQILLKHKANFEARDLYDNTPLMIAVLYGSSSIANLLLEHGADVDAIRSDGWTMLHMASGFGQFDMVKALLERKANVNRLWCGVTSLCVAALRGDVMMMRILIDAGSDPDLMEPDTRMIPLCEAAFSGKSEAVALLLASDTKVANIDIKDISTKTPLFLAVEQGHIETARTLLEAGACPDVKCGERGDTCLGAAVRHGHSELVELLLQYPLIINKSNAHENSPLNLGILCRRKVICQQLLKHGADVDQPDEGGVTPLMQACSMENPDLVNLLLENKAQPDLVSKNLYINAVSRAARYGRIENIKLLINCGASTIPPPSVKKWKNLSFKDHVTVECRKSVLQILQPRRSLFGISR